MEIDKSAAATLYSRRCARQCRHRGEPGRIARGQRVSLLGWCLREAVPEAHKVALADLAEGERLFATASTIGYAKRPIARGSWVHEGLMTAPEAPPLADCPLATARARAARPAGGVHLRGLSQCRRLGGDEEHSRHQHHGAVRRRDGGLRGAAHQGGDSAALSATWTTWSPSRITTAAAWPSMRRARRFRFARCATWPAIQTSVAR